jgi:hypothetical protein
LRLSRVALAVAFFTGSQFQPTEMFPQGVAHQSGPVSLSALRGLIGGLQQPFIEHDLNDLHMWSLFHSILHMEDISKQTVTFRQLAVRALFS